MRPVPSRQSTLAAVDSKISSAALAPCTPHTASGNWPSAACASGSAPAANTAATNAPSLLSQAAIRSCEASLAVASVRSWSVASLKLPCASTSAKHAAICPSCSASTAQGRCRRSGARSKSCRISKALFSADPGGSNQLQLDSAEAFAAAFAVRSKTSRVQRSPRMAAQCKGVRPFAVTCESAASTTDGLAWCSSNSQAVAWPASAAVCKAVAAPPSASSSHLGRPEGESASKSEERYEHSP